MDGQGRLGGRGAWVHPRLDCLKKACLRGFAKSFKATVSTGIAELGEQLVASSQRRLDGLLLAGARRRSVIHGREAVKEVAAKAVLVLLAEDAKSVAKDTTVMALGEQGKVVIWGTKDHYGQLLGKTEVGVLALLEQGIAEAVEKTVSIARLGTLACCGGGDARQLSEIR
jgi:ribosomal protein L7Ae-like RNA K-turn-binding protein